MPPGAYTVRTAQEPVSNAISRLETFVSRMERRYECTSAKMAEDVKSGQARETAEVGRWLADYHVLTHLRAGVAHGRAAGSVTKSIK